jgi:hypothetical protein
VHDAVTAGPNVSVPASCAPGVVKVNVTGWPSSRMDSTADA